MTLSVASNPTQVISLTFNQTELIILAQSIHGDDPASQAVLAKVETAAPGKPAGFIPADLVLLAQELRLTILEGGNEPVKELLAKIVKAQQ